MTSSTLNHVAVQHIMTCTHTGTLNLINGIQGGDLTMTLGAGDFLLIDAGGILDLSATGLGGNGGILNVFDSAAGTSIIINGLDSTPERDDYFMFIWINGKEKLGFSDRRIRLRISPITIIESIKISIDGTQQPIHTIPQPSGIEPDIEIGGIKYKYKGEKDIIFTYTDLNLRTRSQLRLLISGIFIGLLTNLMSEQFLERLKNIKEK